MASYKYYSNTLTSENDSFTHDIDGDLVRTGRSGYIKNTGNEDLTFALQFEGDTANGDSITLSSGEVHGFDRSFYKHDEIGSKFIQSITVARVSADTTYKIYID